jgi:hypothetical protein
MSPWTFPTCRASTTIHRPCSLEERLWNPWEHYASGGLGALEPNHLKAETPVTNRCRDKLGREVNLAQVAEVSPIYVRAGARFSARVPENTRWHYLLQRSRCWWVLQKRCAQGDSHNSGPRGEADLAWPVTRVCAFSAGSVQ